MHPVKSVITGVKPYFPVEQMANINDYFIYNSNDKQLKLVSKKNVQELAATSFADCTAAIDKAKTINGDLSQIRGAVEEYNNRNK